MLAKVDYDGLWTQDGAFVGSDGKPVRAYDDVVLERAVGVASQFGGPTKMAAANTTATVLFFTPGSNGVAELEVYHPDPGVHVGLEDIRFLRLHTTNEEKYPR